MPVFSLDLDLWLIFLACITVSAAANHLMSPLAALVTAALVSTVLSVLIYSVARFLGEGWDRFADSVSHPRGWLLAFAVSLFFAGVVTVGTVIGRRFQRAG